MKIARRHDIIMEKLNKFITFNNQGEIIDNHWICCKHISKGLTHCEICLHLHERWFLAYKSPRIPHHSNCHCIKIEISTPTENDVYAECKLEKFTKYIFTNDEKSKGKKSLFLGWGFTIEDSQYLKETLERQARKAYIEGNYELGKLNEFGQRITIRIEVEKNGKEINFGTGWLVWENGKITNTTPYGEE